MTLVASSFLTTSSSMNENVMPPSTVFRGHAVLFEARCAARSTPLLCSVQSLDWLHSKSLSSPVVILHLMCAAVAEQSGVHDDEVELFVKTTNKMVPLEGYLERTLRVSSNDCGGDGEKDMHSIARTVECITRDVTKNENAELFAVFRIRGGKGKAGFQKTLQRKGREFTRAVRNGQIVTAGALAAAAPRTRTPGARRFGGDRMVNTNRFTSPANATTAATAVARRASGADRQSYTNKHHKAPTADLDRLPPNHPLERLKREQAREQAVMSDWADRMASAIGNGLALMKTPQQEVSPK